MEIHIPVPKHTNLIGSVFPYAGFHGTDDSQNYCWSEVFMDIEGIKFG